VSSRDKNKADSTFDDAEGLDDVLASLRGSPAPEARRVAGDPARLQKRTEAQLPARPELLDYAFDGGPSSSTFASAEDLALPKPRPVNVQMVEAFSAAEGPATEPPGASVDYSDVGEATMMGEPLPGRGMGPVDEPSGHEFIPIEAESEPIEPRRSRVDSGEHVFFSEDERLSSILPPQSRSDGEDDEADVIDADDVVDELDDAELLEDESFDAADDGFEDAPNPTAFYNAAAVAAVVKEKRRGEKKVERAVEPAPFPAVTLKRASATEPPVMPLPAASAPSYGNAKEPSGQTVVSSTGAALANVMFGAAAKAKKSTFGSDEAADSSVVSELEPMSVETASVEASADLAALTDAPASFGEQAGLDPVRIAELRAEGKFSEIVDLYYAHMVEVTDASVAARVAFEAGTIAATELLDEARAIEVWSWSIQADPYFDEPQIAIETLIAKSGASARARWNSPLARIQKAAEATDDESVQAAYFAVLARWYLNELKRRDLGGDYLTKLERLDPRHPLILERKANEARAADDPSAQAHLLVEALERVTRPSDRSRMYIELGELYDGPFEDSASAGAYYEAALALDPNNLKVLRALSRMAKSRNDDAETLRFTIAEYMLSPKGRAKVELALAAVDLYLRLGQPGEAHQLVTQILQDEPANAKAMALAERALLEGGGEPRQLAELYRSKIEKAKSPRARGEAQQALADLYEHRLENPRAAYDLYLELERGEPRNKKFPTELERLAVELGMHEKVLIHSTTIAELTTEPKEASSRYVIAGDYALDALTEPNKAKALYLKALERDRRNLVAMERLETVESRLGNDDDALAWFEKRAQSTEDKTLRAELLYQVAERKLAQNDVKGGVASLEAARGASPENDLVASALVERYVEAGRFDAAWPVLAELVKRMRVNPPEPEVQLARYRLGIRVAAARNLKEAALECALLGYRAMPESSVAQDDLVSVAFKVDATIAGNARNELIDLAANPHDLSEHRIVQLGQVLLRLGESRIAAEVVDYVERHHEQNVHTLGLRESALEAEGRFEELAQAKVDIARIAPPEIAYKKLVEAGDIWARQLGAPAMAVSAFEMARDLKPEELWILETLAWVYGEVGDIDRQVETLRELLSRATDKEGRVLLLEEIADKYEMRQDPMAAASALDEVLTVDPTRLSAFDRQVKVLKEAHAFEALEGAYVRMAERAAAKPALVAAVQKHLGILRRDKLGDVAGAREAFEISLQIAPTDEETRSMLLDMVASSGDDEALISLLVDSLEADPFQVDTYERLFETHARVGDYDRAWCALDVLAQLRPLSGEQLSYYEDYPPVRLDNFPGTLTEDAWKSHVLHPDLDPLMTALVSWLGPVALRLRQSSTLAQLTPFSASDSPHADVVVSAFENACEILAISKPAICSGRTASREGPFQVSMVPAPKVDVYGPAIEDNLETLVYFIGRTLASMRPELVTAFQFATKEEVASTIGKCMANDGPLWAAMTLDESNVIRDLVKKAEAAGARFDAKKWLLLARVSADRAALLLCGSAHEIAVYYSRVGGLAAATPPRVSGSSPPGASGVQDGFARDKLGLLYRFAVSREHAELRQALGTAVGSEG
jgi:tetratricopeptide (TPR) repeat protein